MNRAGRQTILYPNGPFIRSAAAIAGPKEGEGPLSYCFDEIIDDDLLGKESWELAESEMLRRTIALACEKGGMTPGALDAMLSGDLLNQITASTFSGRSIGAPFFGLYGACSTMIEEMIIAAAMIDGHYLRNAVCASSSHFSTAEHQYRFPLEMGAQRPPSAQWTATAAGALIIEDKAAASAQSVRIACGTIGRIVDYRIADANHMGAAMAPAVADTITMHLSDTGRTVADYDLIVTGDLATIGRKLLIELLLRRGIKIPEDKLFDCGASIYSPDQNVQAGGSGCGCIASVLCGLIIPRIESGELKRVLALGSGAFLSATSTQQGQTIPSISYGIVLEGA